MTAGAYPVFLPKSDDSLYRALSFPDSGDDDLAMTRLEEMVRDR